MNMLLVINYQDLLYFGLALFLVLIGLLVSFIFGWWLSRRTSTPSPYTNHPLRYGSDLNYRTVEKVLRFLYDMRDYHNRMFDLNRAAICRDTGRIFSEALTWLGSIKVDWDFLPKKFPGKFVSWGSLTLEQQEIVRSRHKKLDGFQTDFSSPNSSPRKIEAEYAYTKPGPLYVDIDSAVLLGWKVVPGTELEVLIVQKPVEKIIPGMTSK